MNINRGHFPSINVSDIALDTTVVPKADKDTSVIAVKETTSCDDVHVLIDEQI